MTELEKPIDRSLLRQILGKEYFILKRKLNWYFGDKSWAKSKQNDHFDHEIFNHKSLILRPLKDVDMYLQENKRTNLKLAIQHTDSIIIKPK